MIIFKYEITRSEVYRRVRQCEKIKEISIEQADSMEQVGIIKLELYEGGKMTV